MACESKEEIMNQMFGKNEKMEIPKNEDEEKMNKFENNEVRINSEVSNKYQEKCGPALSGLHSFYAFI